jgi:hypothetical protein
MATITPEATAPDGGLTLADTDPEVEHFAPGSDRFVVKFRFIGPDLLQLSKRACSPARRHRRRTEHSHGDDDFALRRRARPRGRR